MSTTPGWYPDPSDPTRTHLRWWDGARWTEHVHQQAPSLTKAPQEVQRGAAAPTRYPPSQYPAPGVKAIATPDGQALGNLGLRLVARIVDAVVVTVIASLAGRSSLAVMTSLSQTTLDRLLAGDSAAVADLVANTSYNAAAQRLTLVLVAVSAAYTVLTTRFYGATPGKALCGLRVRDWDRPGLPTTGQAVVRWIGSDLLGSIIGLWYLVDFLWPTWDQRRQAVHDKLARTVVVKRR
ncbi:RDD family protein [Kineococcus aurantiacus]|uniref:Putative RDD family membrane protein YckC n=1 Tax=Kineococcus aurantiacus TaxID=37633 RepID=A0A7Y9J1Y8_9ACTN|nr:putative RDD family membrane protein YckC [Kineococcus aurantiacus]